jgi:adenosylcobinamide-GDP ribazoletransferase
VRSQLIGSRRPADSKVRRKGTVVKFESRLDDKSASIRAVTRLVNAARYLTILPIPGARAAHHEGPGAAAAWFPVVGLGIGALLALADRLMTGVFVSLLAALLIVTLWKLITGGLHLDGLADCLDGLVGRDPAHRLAIMHDSRIGAFGAMGLVLFLMLEVAAVSGIDAHARGSALLLAPVVARAMPPIVARVFPAAGSGHGASFRTDLGRAAPVIAVAFALVVALVTLGARGVVALVIATALSLAVGAFMSRRLGGISGDVHGAVIELSEVVVLLTAAAGPGPRA